MTVPSYEDQVSVQLSLNSGPISQREGGIGHSRTHGDCSVSRGRGLQSASILLTTYKYRGSIDNGPLAPRAARPAARDDLRSWTTKVNNLVLGRGALKPLVKI